ncbi:MAG: glycosyltransferase family 4 protein [Planctomycetota bacterium]|jgi:glycosyltransferase involved in cell wall biosynthesis
MNIIMISADVSVVAGDRGPFYYMLEEFHRHFDRIDVIGLKPARKEISQIFGNVFLNHPDRGKLYQPAFIVRTGKRLMKKRHYAFAISHDYNFFYNGLGAYLLHRKTDLPYFSEIHHVPGHPRAAGFRERVDKFCTRLYTRWVQNHALAIRVVNSGQLPALLESWGVRRDKIRVLYSLYMDFDTYHPADREAEKTFDLVFCGRLVPNKGIFILLEALKILKQKHGDIKLLMIGRGTLEVAVENYLAQNGLAENVERVPWVADTSELARLYRQARLLVCASYNEGGPRVTVEAMACGTPAISTPVGIMPELIREGENGMLFDWNAKELAEKADLLFSDADLYARIRSNLPGTVAPFERKKVITDLAAGFKEMLPSAS